MIQPILIDNQWQVANAVSTFQPLNPITKEPTGETYPVSSLADIEQALKIAATASEKLLSVPTDQLALFLESYAGAVEDNRKQIVEMANRETGYPIETRKDGVELPRTTNQ